MINKITKNLSNEKFQEILDAINSGKNVSIFGCSFYEKIWLINSIEKNIPIIVCQDAKEIVKYKKYLENLNYKCACITNAITNFALRDNNSNEEFLELLISMYNLVKGDVDILIISPEVVLQKLPSIELFSKNILSLKTNQVLINPAKLLSNLGYNRVEYVSNKGEFAIRGDLIDIFPINSEYPILVSLWGDEVESIKTYFLETFSMIEQFDNFDICPNTIIFVDEMQKQIIIKEICSAVNTNQEAEYNSSIIKNKLLYALETSENCINMNYCYLLAFLKNYNSTIFDYVSNKVVVFDEVKIIYEKLQKFLSDYSDELSLLLKSGKAQKQHTNFYFNIDSISNSSYFKISFMNINTNNRLFSPDIVLSVATRPSINYYGNYNNLEKDLDFFLKNNYTVLIFGINDTNSVNINNYLNKKYNSILISDFDKLEQNRINIISRNIITGGIFADIKLAIISSEQLSTKTTITRNLKIKKKTLYELPKINDYVVHDIHGIGQCIAIEKRAFNNFEKDYIVIKYDNNDIFYLPTEQIESLSAYNGAEKTPRLNRLGTQEFLKIKEKVKSSIKEMAFNLQKLYAERQVANGYKYEIDDEMYNEFIKGFAYEETTDQLQAIEDTIVDMSSGKVMDRLVCGDVGYGKTEVALRAAFITIMNGKQVAILAPTTILAEQHYNTCLNRFAPFKLEIDCLNRFRSKKEQSSIVARVVDGTNNIICGTHRLLSNDVKFKDLGLLILDEEQRFGVADKEKIKLLKKNVNVITLSATPIPRTLHMSMIGIRDISLMETAPKNRLPIQTIVTEYSDDLVVDAVERELNRKGQVLVLYNRVETINDFSAHLQKLLPKVKIGVAHGQMSEKELDISIKNLFSGNTEVLVATTLIENGIDLPTANTIIIVDADRLGLSELYQLRGRIGRSDKLGYAYLTYTKQKVLTEDAYKRLNAMIEFSQLGSGYKIALKDLEIRGAGNVLGSAQHGHIGRVGYDMYCKLLKEAIEELSGQGEKIKREVKINITVDAFIPTDYISSSNERFRIYTSLMGLDTIKQRDEIMIEISKLYGRVPQELNNLANIVLIKNLAQKLSIKNVNINSHKTEFVFYDKNDALCENITKALSENSYGYVLKIQELPIIHIYKTIPDIQTKISNAINFLINSNL